MLVVVENRNVHQFAQALLDDETVRRPNVFEVDAAEGRSEVADRIDEGVDVLGVDFEIDRIDIGEALEQDGLALHHRLRGKRAEIAETENRRAVGNHRDQIAADRVVVGFVRIFRDRKHRNRDAGRIGERQVALGRHRLGRNDLDLARPPARMELERLLIGHGGALGLGLFLAHCGYRRDKGSFWEGFRP